MDCKNAQRVTSEGAKRVQGNACVLSEYINSSEKKLEKPRRADDSETEEDICSTAPSLEANADAVTLRLAEVESCAPDDACSSPATMSKPRWADLASDEEQAEATDEWVAVMHKGRCVPASVRQQGQQAPQLRAVARAERQPPASSKRAPRDRHRDEQKVSHSGSTPPGKYSPPSDGKAQSQYLIGIEEEPSFKVVRKILGPSGANMKRIAQQTGAKLRLRGRGSKFLEGPMQQESTDPLMLCLSAPDRESHAAATKLVSELLEDVYDEYRRFCARKAEPCPDLQLKVHVGYREGAKPKFSARKGGHADAW